MADAGDMAVNPFNINEAIETIQQNALDLTAGGSKLVTLGGDHTIALPLLRAAAERAGGPIAMLHFDAHLDTWDTYFGAEYTHGTPFRRAVEEGILDTEAISHIGTRGPLYGKKDLDDDHRFGFGIVTSADVYYQGVLETVAKVRDRIGNRPLYISVDIDVLDPAHAPGTGTPEAGGITSRELLEIIRGFRGMNLVGADIVEVAPAYDHAEITGVAASHVAYELVTLMADNAVAGDRFGAANGYAAQALGQEVRQPAGFAAAGQGVSSHDRFRSGHGSTYASAKPAQVSATAGTSSSKPSKHWAPRRSSASPASTRWACSMPWAAATCTLSLPAWRTTVPSPLTGIPAPPVKWVCCSCPPDPAR